MLWISFLPCQHKERPHIFYILRDKRPSENCTLLWISNVLPQPLVEKVSVSYIKSQTWQFPFPHNSDLPVILTLGNTNLTKWSFRLSPLQNSKEKYPGKLSYVPCLVLEEYIILVKYFWHFEKPDNMCIKCQSILIGFWFHRFE